ncbi:MAG: mechanosensitive ion channel [Vicinamibacterales bacterium]
MFQNSLARMTAQMGEYLPSVLGALLILVAGWLIALVVSSTVRALLHRTTLDNRIAGWIAGEGATDLPLERYIASAAFWLTMLFVLVAFFDALRLPVVAGPLNALLVELGAFAPKILGGLALTIVAAILAMLLRRATRSMLTALGADERLGTGEARPIAASLGEVVYWTTWLLFLPMILSTLELTGLIEPVQALLNKALAFLPNLVAAGLALAVGWFIAHLVRRIVTNLLVATGADRFGAATGVSQVLGQTSLSAAIGTVVYTLILIPVVITALNALQIDAVTAPASNMLNTLLAAVPAIFAAALVLVLSYVVGTVVAGLVTRALDAAGFNRLFAAIGFTTASAPAEGGRPRPPSVIAGQVVLVAVLLFAALEAAGLLGFEAVQVLLGSFLVLAGHLLLGLAIFAAGLYLSGLAARAVRSSGVADAAMLAVAARLAVIVLSGAMALRQMGLANEIINLAFGFLVGAIAVAAALAFGLGARETAGRHVEEWVRAYRGRQA